MTPRTFSLVLHSRGGQCLSVEFAPVLRGERGLPGPAGGTSLVRVAAVTLSGHRVVTLDAAGLAIYASSATPDHAHRVLGITLHAAAAGDEVSIIRSGEVEEPSWSWDLARPLFLGPDGVLTQTAPAAGFTLIVGFPIAATRAMFAIGTPIIAA